MFSSSIGGVGIVFQPIDSNTLVVKGLRPDSQAAMSGLVQIGDRLVAVNELQVLPDLYCVLLTSPKLKQFVTGLRHITKGARLRITR